MKKNVNLESFRRRYVRAKRKGKSKLLDELCHLYSYNRKYLLQFFNGLTGKKHLRSGPKKQYSDKDFINTLKRIWLASDQMCSIRLKAALPLWLPHYDEELSEAIKARLICISPRTIDRVLKPYRAQSKRHGLTGTRPGYLLKNQFPSKQIIGMLLSPVSWRQTAWPTVETP